MDLLKKRNKIFNEKPNDINKYYLFKKDKKGYFFICKNFNDNKYLYRVLKKKKIKINNNIDLELNIIKNYKINGIIELLDFIETKNFYWIKMPFPNLNLRDYLINKKYMPEKNCRELAFIIINVLGNLHNDNICHGNLTLESIGLINNLSEIFKPVLYDFSFSFFLNELPLFNLYENNTIYRAPEILFNNFNEKIDIYSLGIIIYILLIGENPFLYQNSFEQYIENINFENSKWNYISTDACLFVQLCVNKKFLHRPTAYSCLSLPWFSDLNNLNLQNFNDNSNYSSDFNFNYSDDFSLENDFEINFESINGSFY